MKLETHVTTCVKGQVPKKIFTVSNFGHMLSLVLSSSVQAIYQLALHKFNFIFRLSFLELSTHVMSCVKDMN